MAILDRMIVFKWLEIKQTLVQFLSPALLKVLHSSFSGYLISLLGSILGSQSLVNSETGLAITEKFCASKWNLFKKWIYYWSGSEGSGIPEQTRKMAWGHLD